MPDSIFWAWLAGFWEGEGSLRFVPQEETRFAVAQVDPKPLNYIKATLGFGAVYTYPRRSPWKPMSNYIVTNANNVMFILENMLPYLRFRDNQVRQTLAQMKAHNWTARLWTEKENEYVRASAWKLSDAEIAKTLGRTPAGVKQQREDLGILYPSKFPADLQRDPRTGRLLPRK